MTFRETISWLSAATFCLLWLTKGCGGTRCPDVTVKSDTVTVYQDTGQTRWKDKPVPYAVAVPGPRQVDSFFRAWDGDTVALITDYFSTRSYAVEYDTMEVKLSVAFDVWQNRLKDSISFTLQNTRPIQMIVNTPTVHDQPKLSLWLGAGARQLPDGGTFTGLARAQTRRWAFEYGRGLDGANEVRVSGAVVKFGRK